MKKGVFEEIIKISSLLKKNKLGIFPCKNSYMIIGLASGDNDKKIRDLKEKKVVRPLVRVLLELPQDKEICNYFSSLSNQKKDLIEIFKYSDLIFASVEKGIGFTFAMNPYERRLLSILKKAIYASSSNISGKPTPFSCNLIAKNIKKSVDFILDVGELQDRRDFAVINLDNLQWLREGSSTSIVDKYLREIRL